MSILSILTLSACETVPPPAVQPVASDASAKLLLEHNALVLKNAALRDQINTELAKLASCRDDTKRLRKRIEELTNQLHQAHATVVQLMEELAIDRQEKQGKK